MHLLALLFIVSVINYGGCGSIEPENPIQVIDKISAEQAYKLIQENKNNPDFKIIDVRTPEEYAEGYIEDSILIDFYAIDFRERIEQLGRDGTYLIY